MIATPPKKIAKSVFDIGNQEIVNDIVKIGHMQDIDYTLTYVFIKAFNLHLVKIYLENNGKEECFQEIYSNYRIYLDEYYKENNDGIPKEILVEILNAFDKSFQLIESLGYDKNVVNDSYGLRHYLIENLEFLRQILEKKSKANIRIDLFENSVSSLKNILDEVVLYIDGVDL